MRSTGIDLHTCEMYGYKINHGEMIWLLNSNRTILHNEEEAFGRLWRPIN